MFEYILLTYKSEELDPESCHRFMSEMDDLDLDPHNNENIPMVLGSNQTIRKYEDSPIKSCNIIYARHGWEMIQAEIKSAVENEADLDTLKKLSDLSWEYWTEMLAYCFRTGEQP